MKTTRALLSLFLILASKGFAQNAGDEWTTTRGDETPGFRYSLAETTSSGRIIGLNSGGSLMINDGGNQWRFDRIEINGVPVRGTFTDLYQVPGGSLIAVMVRLEESSQGFFKYQARTYFVSSNDNGNTWTQSAFPITTARYRGRDLHGVMITGLKRSPGGELLAYGTIAGTNHPGILWNIGGLILRQSGNWQQAHFGYGPIDKIADANGRAVATAFNAILDSADGAGWNGYRLTDAQITRNGMRMDSAIQEKLRIIDVEVIDGNYVGLGATFVPLPGTNIDTNIFNRLFKLSSPTPFSGARNWDAFDQNFYPGTFNKVENRIIAASSRGAYLTTGGGSGFSLVGAEVRASGKALTVKSASDVFAVQSSDTVWKSSDGGRAWAKIWDKDVGPDLRILGFFDGLLFARANNRELWISEDQGSSWIQQEIEVRAGATIVKGENGRLIMPGSGPQILVSDDRGLTWEPKVLGDSREGGFLLQRSKSGRLIQPLEGKDVRNEGKFFISDDNGDTWEARTATGLAFGEDVRDITQAKSGRLLVGTNTFASFNPKLYLSDDDGDTWKQTEPLANLEGLDTVTGDASQKVYEWSKLRTSKTGRILAMSETVIIYSDDEGDTWELAENFDFNGTGSLDFFELSDLIQAGSRWVGIGHYRTPFPQRRNKHFIIISDDDGATWGLRPFETNQPNTFLQTLGVTDGGQLIITGQNASVFVSDFDLPMEPMTATRSILEGGVRDLTIDRPDLDGKIEVSYMTVEGSAVAGADFVASDGMLTWEADEMEPKVIMIETINNDTVDQERVLGLQLSFETSDGLLGQIDVPISIKDNDNSGLAGILFDIDGGTNLYTSEMGQPVKFGVALEAAPTSDVTINITGVDESEGLISINSLTFTPGNWSEIQTLTITGVDDPDPDGDATYSLLFSNSSDDERYAELGGTTIGVTNRGDEPLPGSEENPLDALLKSLNVQISNELVVTFTVPANLAGVTFGSETSMTLENGSWIPGPTPIPGAPVEGIITYSLTLPGAATESYLRIVAASR